MTYLTDEKLVVRAEVPGMKLEEFEISVSDDTLTVQGSRRTGDELEGGWYHRREREAGKFSRVITVPSQVDTSKVEAHSENGILTVVLPKAESAKPKQITIKTP